MIFEEGWPIFAVDVINELWRDGRDGCSYLDLHFNDRVNYVPLPKHSRRGIFIYSVFAVCSTVVDACQYEFLPMVVEEAVGDHSAVAHKQSLKPVMGSEHLVDL